MSMRSLSSENFLSESLSQNKEMVNNLSRKEQAVQKRHCEEGAERPTKQSPTRLLRSLRSLAMTGKGFWTPRKVRDLLQGDIYDLLYIANRVRQKNVGDKIKFCSIVNARSGRCSEDCKFCAQSSHYDTDALEYGLRDPQEIVAIAKESKAPRFCIVTSGRGIKEWDKIYETIRLIRKETDLKVEASLGCIDLEHARLLKEAGLVRYNHNLETSPRFFPYICTTHSFNDRLKTAQIIKEAGLELCSGGIFGMGETWDDRIELALILKEVRPHSIPLNFLRPILGTPLGDVKPLSPQEILRIIAIFRIVLPTSDIFICGGREYNLRDLQSWMFYAGANATMLGNYLTTLGRPPSEDLQMIEDLGLCPELS